jgi:gamma-glutamyltranspeptidase/glutathione hydrolase
MRDFQLPGRSAAHAAEAMVATSHPLATLAALDVLKAGGAAMDAAVAATAVMCVTEPAMTGIGGDCFVLYAPKGGDKVTAYNGSGRAPKAASVEALRAKGVRGELEPQSAHSVTVPGCVQAWERLVADHGRKELGALLEPAIKAAEQGFAVTPRVAYDWANAAEKLKRDPGAREIFLPGGRAPRAGERFRNPRLAATLKKIARGGAKAFYTGDVARDMVKTLNGYGALHTIDDFAATEGEYAEPISTEYRGHAVHECPPNGQGITALLMLNILKGYELGKLNPGGAERMHLEVEATRLAFADRNAYVADPRFGRVPVEELLSAKHSADQRARISRERAMEGVAPVPLPAHNDTIYLCVVDRDRNAVSFINSVFDEFGSGLVAPETGIVLHNRGYSFRMDPKHPNCIAGGKRPMHTIIPGMLTKDGKCRMPFGVMGAHYQPIGHTHLVTNMLDWGMDPQEAIDFPRAHHRDGVVQLERGFPASTAQGLQALGHRAATAGKPIGGGQAIWIDWENGTLVGGSEPRKDGFAAGY